MVKANDEEKKPVVPVQQCSYFMQHGDKPVVKEMTPSASWTLKDIATYVKSNVGARNATEYLRSLTDEDAQKEFKKRNFDMIIPGGTLKSRKRGKNEVTPNGECCLDIDHINEDIVEALFNDFIADKELPIDLMFRSPRGHGLKIFMRYDPREITHKEFYNDISVRIFCKYGVMADMACADITHTCLLPYDPNVYFGSSGNVVKL